MKHGITARILISLLGAAFIVWGAGLIALGTAGERTSAVITAIRREGGERNIGKSGQYLYNIGYTFTLPDGRKINGISKKTGNGVYVKADGSSTRRVRYFSAFPYFNALEEETGFGVGQVGLMFVGVVLIVLVNRKGSAKKTRRRKDEVF
jgi:hypothetical protein